MGLLDAKYRASRTAVNDSLGDVHVYRDALRWSGTACKAAFIVVPALAQGARRYGDQNYHERYSFGALVVDPPIPGNSPQVKDEWVQPALLPIADALAALCLTRNDFDD